LRLLFRFALLTLLIFNGLLYLVRHQPFQPLFDLALAVDAELSVALGDVVPEEDNIKDSGDDQAQSTENPDDEGEQHTAVNDTLHAILVEECSDVDPKLLKTGMVGGLGRDDVSGEDGVQGHGVDALARTFGEDDAKGGFEGEVDEKGDIIGTLFTLGELGEDQEAPPTLISHTLDVDGQWVEEVISDSAPSDDADGANPFVEAKGPRDENANGEDPLAVFEVQSGFDAGAPTVESQQVDGREGIDHVDGDTDKGHDP
jgi:hypothetical protein